MNKPICKLTGKPITDWKPVAASGVTEIIASRAKTHGDWNEVARISNGIKALFRSGASWQSMTPSQQEAMDMKAVKQARIVCGNPNEPDHWADDIGYSTLAKP